MTELHRPAPLDPKRHDRTFLDSGAESLDAWLRRQAGQSRRENTAATWVVSDSGNRMVAYISMSMSAIDFSRAPEPQTARGLSQVPALLCGRLAVDRRYRGLGLGRVLVELLLTTALQLNETAACRAVVVHAIDAEARAFWERFGFVPFTESADERDLYLLTKDVAATFGK